MKTKKLKLKKFEIVKLQNYHLNRIKGGDGTVHISGKIVCEPEQGS